MRYHIAFLLFCILSFSQSNGQSHREIEDDALEALSSNINDTTYVVNFLATWCSPCHTHLQQRTKDVPGKGSVPG